MLSIRPIRYSDVAFAVKLTDQENWGVTGSDVRRLMRLNPHGCFLAHDGKTKLGITTTTSYGAKVAWIGNVIVDKDHRGRNVGHMLIQHAVTYLQKTRIRHITLYCYREHVKFYEDLGFVRDRPFVRMRREALAKRPLGVSKLSKPPAALPDILAADKRAFGADRSKLIGSIIDEKIGRILCSSGAGSSSSYMMVKNYGKEHEIGPWICPDPSRDDPDIMMKLALNKIGSAAAEASCIQTNREAVKVLKANHFRAVRTGYRMFFKRRAHLGNDNAQFALGFLDKG